MREVREVTVREVREVREVQEVQEVKKVQEAQEVHIEVREVREVQSCIWRCRTLVGSALPVFRWSSAYLTGDLTEDGRRTFSSGLPPYGTTKQAAAWRTLVSC